MRLLRNAILSVGLAGLSVGAFACGGSSKSEETTPAATETPAEEMPAEGGDMGGEGAEGTEGTEEAPPADGTGDAPEGGAEGGAEGGGQ